MDQGLATDKSLSFEQLEVGTRATLTRTLGPAEVRAFADLTGDHNPVHLDPDYARTTRFGGCIVHGMLVGSLVSAALAARLPGPGTIYLQQSLKFRAPVPVGSTVVVTLEVLELIPDKRRVRLLTTASVGETAVLEGEALVRAPD